MGEGVVSTMEVSVYMGIRYSKLNLHHQEKLLQRKVLLN